MKEDLLPELRKIEHDPFLIKSIQDPTLDEQLLAINNNPKSIKFIEQPLLETQFEAIEKDPHSIQFFEQKADKNVRFYALKIDPKVIQYFTAASYREINYAVSRDKKNYNLVQNKTWKTDLIILAHILKFSFIFFGI